MEIKKIIQDNRMLLMKKFKFNKKRKYKIKEKLKMILMQ